jgi:hypothetical protein
MRLRFVLAAHPDHALHRLPEPATMPTCVRERQLVVRRDRIAARDAPSLEAMQRWTVSNMVDLDHRRALGLWLCVAPGDKIRDELAAGSLQPVRLREGGERFAQLYLVFADRDGAGPARCALAEIIRELVKSECSQETGETPAGDARRSATAR